MNNDQNSFKISFMTFKRIKTEFWFNYVSMYS